MNSQNNNPNIFKSFIKDYFVSISLNEEDISIVIYNTTLLDNIRYEINFDLEDMKNLSCYFSGTNLNGIFNMLINLINLGKLNLEKQFNDLILSFLMSDAGFQVNNMPIKIILFGERDSNEYLFVLTQEIQKLRNQLNDLNNKINNQNQNPISMNQINQNNNPNIINNNSNNMLEMSKVIVPNTNTLGGEADSDDFFKNLNIDINDNIQELTIKEKLLDDKIFIHLNHYELNRLTNLILSHNKIVGIRGIEYSKFPNLEQIYLNYNCIKDLVSLSKAKFPKLKKLWLFGNEITNISPLANSNFPILETLSLSKNEIGDLNPLRNFKFPRFRVLILDNNNISDISVFQYTNFKLEKLALNDNKIDNISVFEFGNFRDLTHLYLYNNLIVDTSPFSRANLEKLIFLSLNRNKIKNISFLENPLLKELKELYLCDNQINDLSVFSRINIRFTKLYIYGNSFDVSNNSGILKSLDAKIGEFSYKK